MSAFLGDFFLEVLDFCLEFGDFAVELFQGQRVLFLQILNDPIMLEYLMLSRSLKILNIFLRLGQLHQLIGPINLKLNNLTLTLPKLDPKILLLLHILFLIPQNIKPNIFLQLIYHPEMLSDVLTKTVILCVQIL